MCSISKLGLDVICSTLDDKINAIEEQYSIPYRCEYNDTDVLSELFDRVADIIESYFNFERDDLLEVISSVWFRKSMCTFTGDLVFTLKQFTLLCKNDCCVKNTNRSSAVEEIDWPPECVALEDIDVVVDRHSALAYIRQYSAEDIVANNTNRQLWDLCKLCYNVRTMSSSVKCGLVSDLKDYTEKHCEDS